MQVNQRVCPITLIQLFCDSPCVCVHFLWMKTVSPTLSAEKDLPWRIQLDLQSNNNSSPRKSYKVNHLAGGAGFGWSIQLWNLLFVFPKEIYPLGYSAVQRRIEVNPFSTACDFPLHAVHAAHTSSWKRKAVVVVILWWEGTQGLASVLFALPHLFLPSSFSPVA